MTSLQRTLCKEAWLESSHEKSSDKTKLETSYNMAGRQASKGSKLVKLQDGSGTLPNQRIVGTRQQNKTKDITEIGDT